MIKFPAEMATASKARMTARVLVVDDDPDSREALGLVFSANGGSCQLVGSGAAALDALARGAFDVVLCDVRMDGMGGLELLDRVKKSQPTLPFVMITGMAGVHDAVDAMKRGAFEYVVKPCDADELHSVVVGAIGDKAVIEDPASTRVPVPALPTANLELFGDGSAMRALQTSIDRVATSSAPVLITGETGVGKELVARAIHARGDRKSRPFIAVNTSAVQEDLFESEVFGHVRGAFTGAAQSRKGLLTEAHGGTLLLDEVGDMPLGMQAKLLRVLQFGEIRPVGSDRVHFVDVRVLAATHRDLPALVREGRFREDLYFRLNVLPIEVPPLRERREDIPGLAVHFLAEALRRAPRSLARSIGDDAMRALLSAPWSGNVRELASAIERAVVFSSGESLCAKDVLTVATVAPSSGASPVASWIPASLDPPWTLKHMSQAYVEWVLAHAGGDKQRCAEILGIDISTLYRRQRAGRDGRDEPSDETGSETAG